MKSKSVKSIIWQVIGYLIYTALVIFIVYQISNRAMQSRLAKYQSNYINDWYVKTTDDDLKKSQNYHERYLAEAMGLQNGFIDLDPIYEVSITKDDFGKDPKAYIEFDLKAYRAGFLEKKGNYKSGYIIYFPKFDYYRIKTGEKDPQKLDLTYRSLQENVHGNGEQILPIFEKEFNQTIFDNNYFKLTLEFKDRIPNLLKDQKEKQKVSSLIIPSAPLFLTEESLKSGDKTIADITGLKISYLPGEKIKAAKDAKQSLLEISEEDHIGIVRLVKKGYNNDITVKVFKDNLKLDYDDYKFSKDEVNNLNIYKKEKGSEEIPELPITGENKVIRVDVNKALSEFNKTPAIIISVVIVLVILATYFLFGHRRVMAKVRAKKAEKQKEEVDPGFQIDGNVEDLNKEDVKDLDKEDVKDLENEEK